MHYPKALYKKSIKFNQSYISDLVHYSNDFKNSKGTQQIASSHRFATFPDPKGTSSDS